MSLKADGLNKDPNFKMFCVKEWGLLPLLSGARFLIFIDRLKNNCIKLAGFEPTFLG